MVEGVKYRVVATVLATFVALAVACSPPSEGGGDGGMSDVDAGDNTGADANPNGDPDAMPPEACAETLRLEGYTSAGEVALTGSFTGWAATAGDGAIAMTSDATGWQVDFEFEPGVHQYKFVVDGTTWLTDTTNPETEPDGFGGFNSIYRCNVAGVCGSPDDFDWRDTVMYFAMVDRFFDSDNVSDPVGGVTDGDATVASSGQYEGGDLPGVADKVPYLADLGVTSLWLSAPFENRNSAGQGLSDNNFYSGYHGYWPSPANVDYSDPNNPSPRPSVESRIGNEQNLRDIITAAHAADSANGQGIKVLFDYVMNHVDYESGLFQSHQDWFAYDGPGFKLCGSDCGGHSCWDDSYWGTRCAFTDYLPPLDLYNDSARAWSVNDAIWWAKEMGIDGYRLDAIKHVPLSWLTDLRSRLDVEFPSPEGDRFYLVGETFDYFNRDLLKSFVNSDTMLDGQFDFPYKRELCEAVFNPFGNLGNFSAFMDDNDHFYDISATNPSLMTTWIGNHDIPRTVHFASWQFGNCTEGSHSGNSWNSGSFQQPGNAEPYERMALAYAIMMTNPGIPLIYYGDEVGLAGGGDPDNRRMMPWNDQSLSSHQLALRDKVRTLARLRGEFKSLGRGSRQTLQADGDTWVYRRGGCGQGFDDVVVAINRADSSRTVLIPSGSYTDRISGNDVDGGNYDLGARSFLVLVPR
jgi:glycosidase